MDQMKSNHTYGLRITSGRIFLRRRLKHPTNPSKMLIISTRHRQIKRTTGRMTTPNNWKRIHWCFKGRLSKRFLMGTITTRWEVARLLSFLHRLRLRPKSRKWMLQRRTPRNMLHLTKLMNPLTKALILGCLIRTTLWIKATTVWLPIVQCSPKINQISQTQVALASKRVSKTKWWPNINRKILGIRTVFPRLERR